MVILLSPAKSLNESPDNGHLSSSPALMRDANKLAKILKGFKADQLQELMHISPALATENYKRYKNFKLRNAEAASKRAVDMFMGDVYRGLNVEDFTDDDYNYAQEHLRILSGLYGVLRPLDLIQPYRLEMGTSFKNPRGSDLYAFWGDQITKQINKETKGQKKPVIINLASNEYFKAVDSKALDGEVITPVF